jgi:hypothetical protein
MGGDEDLTMRNEVMSMADGSSVLVDKVGDWKLEAGGELGTSPPVEGRLFFFFFGIL